MTTSTTLGRRLGAVALGVGMALLAYGFAGSQADGGVTTSTENYGTTTDATDDVSGTDSDGSPRPTVAGVTVTREQSRSASNADDYTLMIIGVGLALAGGATLRLGNRPTTIAASPPDPYRPRHLR